MPLDNIPREALTLPSNYVPPEKVEKRMALKPDFSTLNNGQSYALGFMQSYILGELKKDDGTPKYLSILLEGYAGTGKSYLVNRFGEWLLTVMKLKVAMTAPTNKAVNVLNDGAEYTHPKLKYATIHKLLGLKEQINELNGKQTFGKSFDDPSEIEEYDVLIIDEASMLADDLYLGVPGQFEGIKFYNEQGLKLIFIGRN